MKRIILALVIILCAGCTTRTEYGPCVGIADDKDPKLVYKISIWNAILGVVFFELIVPPIIVLAEETFCPIGKKL